MQDMQRETPYMFTIKRKNKSNDVGTNANNPTMKSNYENVGCVAATLSQIISMCVVPLRVRHSDSDNEEKYLPYWIHAVK